ncbi:ABC transporter permease [uncultured Jatrophihabitans sp.]|uniref:ABC transporter permease n=1 Tax=uncultured Jatrophihabitans sp. TaxID=1610747 RepID=UPI0035CBFBD9
MLQFIIAGLVLGGIYAISAAGLVVTYRSAGVLNFSFGAIAYFVARLYYYLHVQHGWGIGTAAVASLVLAGPALGLVLYATLFRSMRTATQLVKIVVTLGVSVVLPAVADLLFGIEPILHAPGLAPEPVHVYYVDGVPVTLDQIIVYSTVVLILVVGFIIFRSTDIGLRVRAMVDSPAMTSLQGTAPGSVAAGVWAASSFLAGLAGVLSAPIIGLDITNFTLLMAGAFAAVVAAKLRNLPVAVVVGLAMGVAGALAQYWIPPDSTFASAVIPSIPFAVTALFLLYSVARFGRVSEAQGVGGFLDRAITPQGSPVQSRKASHPERGRGPARRLNAGSGVISVAVVALLPSLLSEFWVGLLAQGVALAVLYLSWTLVIGEGGMIWLCQVTFGGVGGMAAAQFATVHGWPVLLAVVAGGLVALPMGLLLGVLTIRLGELYVALVTLTFGLLMDNLVFSRQTFFQNGIGVSLSPPRFLSSEDDLVYLGLVVFGLVALFIVNIRRSTTGAALAAVRCSEPGARTLGISVLQMKVVIAGLAAFVAGVGGALLAVANGVALPANYAALGGVIWLAALVTMGIRSNVAALAAGIAYAILPGVSLQYLPTWFNQIIPILFGLGAIGLTRSPDGVLVAQGQAVRTAADRVRARLGVGTTRGRPLSAEPVNSEPVNSEPVNSESASRDSLVPPRSKERAS